MTVDDYTWSDDDLAWQGVFDADPEWNVPHGVHVFVFKDVDALRRACEVPTAGAFSISHDEADADNVRAVLMFAQPVTLSVVVHEVTHVALYWAGVDSPRPRQTARTWLCDHPEAVPELIGNLAPVLWYSLPKDLLDN